MNNFLTIIRDIALPNKYTDWYIAIIEKSLSTIQTGYTEKHHIVPKSFVKNLSIPDINNTLNIATLTAREHFICHRLLTKMFTGKLKSKMNYAIHRFCYSDNGKKSEIYTSSKHYALIRKQHSENLSGEGNPMFGKTHNQETKNKISTKAKKRIATPETRKKMSESHSGEKNFMFGKTHSPEVKKILSSKHKGKRTGKDNAFYGKKHSKETKLRMSEIRKNQTKSQCPHCAKMVDPSNFQRWHGDNCKLLLKFDC